MNVLDNFKDLFVEIWQQGISGVNFTNWVVITIFLFLLLRGLIAKFILQRLKNYVAKTSNKFDDALVEASAGQKIFTNSAWYIYGNFLYGFRRKNVYLWTI